MKRNYTRIAQRLYKEPWLIVPSVHESIRRQFEAYVKAPRADVPADPDAAEDAAELLPQVTNSIGVIPIYGVLGAKLSLLETDCGGCDVEDVAEQLKAFRDNAAITSIVLDIASPGGCVTGIPELASLIADVDAVKPVYAFCSDQMCSAAYWLGSQCRNIIVSPSSSIGSVGVYIYLEDNSKAYEMEGSKPDPIVSEASPLKLAGADFKPLSDEERAMFQAEVNATYNKFAAAIAAKRTVNPDYLKGQVVDGETAVNVGFADGLANDLDEVITVVTQG